MSTPRQWLKQSFRYSSLEINDMVKEEKTDTCSQKHSIPTITSIRIIQEEHLLPWHHLITLKKGWRKTVFFFFHFTGHKKSVNLHSFHFHILLNAHKYNSINWYIESGIIHIHVYILFCGSNLSIQKNVYKLYSHIYFVLPQKIFTKVFTRVCWIWYSNHDVPLSFRSTLLYC